MDKIKIAIIVAGGKGERMNADIPKQFIQINGKPILMHTLEIFNRFDATMKLIVVLPEIQFAFWNDLCKKHAFDVQHIVVSGGETRFQSVKKGLELITVPALVAVHDGVRPLVTIETIKRCYDAAQKFDAVIPVVDLIDSVRFITDSGNQSVDRNAYKLVQTPQIFDADVLINAYKQDFSPLFTDDASVVESLGYVIELVEGNRENIKITTWYDLKLAETFLNADNDK